MTLPVAPNAISVTNIKSELGVATQWNIDAIRSRALADDGAAGTPLSFSNFHGKSVTKTAVGNRTTQTQRRLAWPGRYFDYNPGSPSSWYFSLVPGEGTSIGTNTHSIDIGMRVQTYDSGNFGTGVNMKFQMPIQWSWDLNWATIISIIPAVGTVASNGGNYGETEIANYAHAFLTNMTGSGGNFLNSASIPPAQDPGGKNRSGWTGATFTVEQSFATWSSTVGAGYESVSPWNLLRTNDAYHFVSVLFEIHWNSYLSTGDYALYPDGKKDALYIYPDLATLTVTYNI